MIDAGALFLTLRRTGLEQPAVSAPPTRPPVPSAAASQARGAPLKACCIKPLASISVDTERSSELRDRPEAA